ncbi:AbrB/MazE/SpoVT family DNA-binding domain-containing protein [Minwuia sp.]|uniref:AbrB/MazE/SpoVT family DNA-binding domain-containing protein n=1 Tax=Minwuia sp. TaxID=2493630 RepID=UPI003A8CC072
MTVLKVRQVGSSLGVILPKELLARMNVEKDDELFVVETKDGIRLSTYDQKVSDQMDEARKIMKRRRSVLRELAK